MEARDGGLMGNFDVLKALDLLQEHLYWSHIKIDVQKFCEKCIVCKKVKYKVMHHGMYTPFPAPKFP